MTWLTPVAGQGSCGWWRRPQGPLLGSGGILQCSRLRSATTSYYSFPMRRTDPISFRIKAEIKEELQRLAEADKRSLSQYIETALEAHIERVKKQAGKKR